jgi:hypothetical protein
VAVPLAGGGSACDGNTALLLLHHPVHGGSTFVHLSDLVGLAGVVQDALAGGGLLCYVTWACNKGVRNAYR